MQMYNLETSKKAQNVTVKKGITPPHLQQRITDWTNERNETKGFTVSLFHGPWRGKSLS